ncbi:MAG: nucleotidyltransferase domain-containing protein [Planctomycetota bacterium]|jgi:hypothetical protein
MIPADLPDPVRKALAAWCSVIEDHLGDRVAATLLHGGMALGEFAPGWSDVDVCVALRGEVPGDEAARLGRALADLHDRFVQEGEAGWASGQFVEGPLLLREDLAAPPAPPRPRWVASAEGLVREEGGGLRPFDRYQLARFGRLLSGEPVPVAPPSREDLRVQLREDLRALDEPPPDRPIWLAAMLHWMARSLAFWRDGEFLTKTAALEREIEAGSRFSDAFRLALDLRQRGSAACAAHLDALRAAFRDTAPAVASNLRERLQSGPEEDRRCPNPDSEASP